MSGQRFILNAAQTQALVSLLTTLGVYVGLDIYEPTPNGDVDVAIWRGGNATLYRIGAAGTTKELVSR
jgi:hypothetical protein